MKPAGKDLTVVAALGITQTIGYGTLYYAFGVLAPAMAAETGWSLTGVFGIFSAALLAGGLVAPRAGRALDRYNAGRVMAAGSAAAALLLAAWSVVPGRWGFAAIAIAVEMVAVLVLYEAAFVAAARLVPHGARRVITGITLIAGFASTIFWPLTSWLSGMLSWREIYLVFAGLNLFVCAPLHLWMSSRMAKAQGKPEVDAASLTIRRGVLPDGRLRRRVFAILLVAFAANAFVISAVHLHLIGLLGALGLGTSAALVGALLGPAQVAGRIIEFGVGERVGPLSVAIFSAAALPAGLAALLAGAGMLEAAIAFAVVFGLGQGLAYIVRGVLPLHLFGSQGYGALMGRINSVRLLVSAAAPFAIAALFERSGPHAALTALLVVGVAGTVALVAIIPLDPFRAGWNRSA